MAIKAVNGISTPADLPEKQFLLHIKYMVSRRCIMMVRHELGKLGVYPTGIILGEVTLAGKISAGLRAQLKVALLKSGLELMDDKKAIMIEKIKNTIIRLVHHSDEVLKTNFSDYLSAELKYDYTYLANLFSEVTGVTIEHFGIIHKIERAKELIVYDELNLTQIASKLHYSSVAHLSNQFKKITGLTPSYFKSLKHKRRIRLEDV